VLNESGEAQALFGGHAFNIEKYKEDERQLTVWKRTFKNVVKGG